MATCMLLGLVLSVAAAGGADDAVLLVEVSSGEEGNGTTPREIAAREDAVALGFNSEFMRVETRRQRQSRVPPQVYWHQEALLARVHDATPVRCATRLEDDGLLAVQALRSTPPVSRR